MRIVTMSECNALKEAGLELARVAQEASDLGINGSDIVLKADADGHTDWARRFGLETLANLTELYHKVIADYERAAETFTGERRRSDETFEAYCGRLYEAFGDLGKLDAMLQRNGIAFVNF